MCSCSKKAETPSKKPTVLVTIAPYAYFVDRIAGDTLDIQTLIPPGTNLHIYEPTPKEVKKSIDAAVWFRIEEPIEKRVVEAIREQNPKQKIINLQDGLTLLGEEETHELTPCQGHDHGAYDLHTWLSPKNTLIQAKLITSTLVSLFPENAQLYEKNAETLFADLKALDQDLEKELAPFKGDALLVSHPALSYFCHNYGLIQLSVECEGKDPRPKDVEEIIKKAEAYSVRCVFLQQGFNNRGAQIIGQKLGLPIYRIDPYDRDYIRNMRQIAEYITQ